MAELTLRCTPWTEDHETREDEEAVTLLLTELLVDGEPIRYRHAIMEWGGRTDGRAGGHDFLSISLFGVPAEDRERYADPSTHLVSTDANMLALPVSKLEFIQ